MDEKILINKEDLAWLLEMAYAYIDDCELGGYAKIEELAIRLGFNVEEIKRNQY